MSRKRRRQQDAPSDRRARRARKKRSAQSRRSGLWIGVSVLVVLLGAAGYLLRKPSFPAVRPADLSQASPRLRQAIDKFVADVEARPGDPAAHGDLGLLYHENGYHHEADACFANAGALDPDNLVWLFHRAMAMRGAGETRAATDLLATIAGKPGAFAAIHYELGASLVEKGDLDAAAIQFERANELASNRPEPRVCLADIYNRTRRYEKAKALAETAIRMDADFPAAHYQLGLALRGVGDREGAKRELQLGVGAEPRSLPDPLTQRAQELGISRTGLIARAIALCDNGDLRGAESLLQQLAKEYPDDVAVMNNLAAVLIQMKRHKDAMEILRNIVRKDDRTFGPYINLSFCSLQLGDYPQAIVFAREAVARGSHVAQCHIALGDALSLATSHEAAMKAYARARELAPDNSQVLVALGRLSRDAGRFDDAIQYLREAVRLKPDSYLAQSNLCAVALESGAMETAIHAFSSVESLNPTAPQTIALRQRMQAVAQRAEPQ